MSLRALVWPSGEERVRLLRIQLRVAVWCSLVGVVYAYVIPPRWETDSYMYAFAVWAATLIRTFEPHLGVALCVAALVGWLIKMRKTALIACVLGLVLLAPTLYAARPKAGADGGADAAAGERLRVVSVNLYYMNKQKNELAGLIESLDADVLLFQEYTPDWHEALSGLRGGYEYTSVVADASTTGMAFYSRVPVVGEAETFDPIGYGHHPQMRAVVEVGGERLTLFNIHTIMPLTIRRSMVSRHRQTGGLLEAILGASDEARQNGGGVIAAGDFNWTNTSPAGAALEWGGMRDGLDASGWGLKLTWPILTDFGRWPLPAIRIDHAYVSEAVVCYRADVMDAPGSDHRLVLIELGIGGAID